MSSWLSKENMILAYIGISYTGGIYFYSSSERFGNPSFSSKGDPNYYKLLLEIGLAPITLPIFIMLPLLSTDNQAYVAKKLIGETEQPSILPHNGFPMPGDKNGSSGFPMPGDLIIPPNSGFLMPDGSIIPYTGLIPPNTGFPPVPGTLPVPPRMLDGIPFIPMPCMPFLPCDNNIDSLGRRWRVSVN